MGWMFAHRPRGMTTAKYLADEFGAEFAAKIKATAMKKGTFYAVIETDASEDSRLVPDENGKVRAAFVVLTKWAKGYYNFGYKEMDEFSGPVESNCPGRLLDMLSPIKEESNDKFGEWAREWRSRCRAMQN